MTNTTFTVGDRVVITERCVNKALHGKIGTVASVADQGTRTEFVTVKFDDDDINKNWGTGARWTSTWSAPYIALLPERKPGEFRVGDRVVVNSNTTTPFAKGLNGTVRQHGRPTNVIVLLDNGKEHGFYPRSLTLLDESAPEPEFERPTIDFSDAHRDRSKAREYAHMSIAQKMEPEHKAVLREVADGKVVDALKLRAALDQAFSLNTTRYGAGRDRRDGAKRIRHLAYIVNGVLENQIESARADYVAGAAGVERHVTWVEAQMREAQMEASRSAAALADEVEAHANARSAVHVAEAAHDLTLADLAKVEGERDVLAQVLEYALSRMEPSERDRTHGYWDALKS